MRGQDVEFDPDGWDHIMCQVFCQCLTAFGAKPSVVDGYHGSVVICVLVVHNVRDQLPFTTIATGHNGTLRERQYGVDRLKGRRKGYSGRTVGVWLVLPA